jgi:uncharacterized protein DUF1905
MTQLARRPAGLKPLSTDLSPEVFTWASELRTLFEATGLSINRFACLHPHIDKGTVSRYLSGTRVPRDRWFLDALITAREDAGSPLTSPVRQHLTELQLRALATAHPHEYKVRQVSDELEIAVTSWQEAERYARNLEKQLAERIRQIHELTADKERLRTAWHAERTALQAEHARLAEEIAALAQQLDLARERGIQAEQRCQQLEGFLEHLDVQRPSLLEIEGQDTMGNAARVLRIAQVTAEHAVNDARQEAEATRQLARRQADEILQTARAEGRRWNAGLVVVTFEAELWRWEARRSESWTFVSLPVEASEEIEDLAGEARRGFGSLRVQAKIGATTWRTSLFPDGSRGSYALPIKRPVRQAEGIEAGDTATVTVELIDL